MAEPHSRWSQYRVCTTCLISFRRLERYLVVESTCCLQEMQVTERAKLNCAAHGGEEATMSGCERRALQLFEVLQLKCVCSTE